MASAHTSIQIPHEMQSFELSLSRTRSSTIPSSAGSLVTIAAIPDHYYAPEALFPCVTISRSTAKRPLICSSVDQARSGWPLPPNQLNDWENRASKNSPSLAVALNCGMGSNSLNAEVNALENIVRDLNSSYFGSKYRSCTV